MANILIADDALFMRMMLKKVLTSGGHTVIGEAENGRRAIELYASLHPDLVVMDITMPDVDGLQALVEITRADPDAHIIMCTALGQQDKVRLALTSGARDYVVKPFDANKLLDTVKRVLA